MSAMASYVPTRKGPDFTTSYVRRRESVTKRSTSHSNISVTRRPTLTIADTAVHSSSCTQNSASNILRMWTKDSPREVISLSPDAPSRTTRWISSFALRISALRLRSVCDLSWFASAAAFRQAPAQGVGSLRDSRWVLQRQSSVPALRKLSHHSH